MDFAGLTKHVDVAFGDGVEAAAREQDHVGFCAFRHVFCGGLRLSSDVISVLVLILVLVLM